MPGCQENNVRCIGICFAEAIRDVQTSGVGLEFRKTPAGDRQDFKSEILRINASNPEYRIGNSSEGIAIKIK